MNRESVITVEKSRSYSSEAEMLERPGRGRFWLTLVLAAIALLAIAAGATLI